ncbi:CDP-glycerol glycerophosphotransferase family protein [Clostridium ihumii]|uniref:CDP-glycerol glycerophosphotransferase family protein n=1 Tax=Clostridium ihumii TaxID=1470356 RepID=UPI00059072D6|nr:CDP-glycerol glycerophosphotransferase family protein [Clostridium ihumii]
MRLNKKNKAIQLMETVEEGFEYILNSNLESSKFMINECLNGMESIHNYLILEKVDLKIIENILNKKESLLNLIENDKNIYREIHDIKVEISEFKKYIKDEVETDIVIAFMPYKISMWDSLESVWMAAKEDENCTCYVVPIPYCELSSERKVERVCYEGNEFPKEVGITHYDDFDLEKIQPDIIYIHNPYDDCNKLTMIYPKFFSENLRNYTNMLVYIPYYIEGSYGVDEIMPHITTKGCINSDRIIAQSKNQKKLFVSYGYSEEKVLNLGSPKFDATLLKGKKESRKIDGKKTILLSTGITDLLADENWINNIEFIIDRFIMSKQCKLIWRRHPLTDITLATMRPNVINNFMKLEQKIQDTQLISIDINKDVYDSISLSDALISDYSSIMFQYMITGKPVLSITRKEVQEQERIYCVDYLANYFMNEGISIDDFIHIILNEDDYKKEERNVRFKKSITNSNGKCGEKIHKTIKKQVLNNL